MLQPRICANATEGWALFNLQISAGKAGELIDRGDNTYGGKFVINPSGGLISKGHPLGATGMCNQLQMLLSCSLLCEQVLQRPLGGSGS